MIKSSPPLHSNKNCKYFVRQTLNDISHALQTINSFNAGSSLVGIR